MEYRIIQDTDLSLLQQVVQDDIDDGWRPCGGLSAYYRPRGDSSYSLFSQAMIRTWWTKTLRNFR